MVHVRRLVKAGNVSHTVSLPVKWLEKNNLRRGDTVYIHETGESELVVSPHLVSEEKEPKEKTIEIDGKSGAALAREITACYINNCTSVVLIGDIESRLQEIRDVVKRFSAFEITEQTQKRILIKDLLNIKEVSIEGTINRMDMILRSMLQDLVDGLETGKWDESMVLRDADMDKFYFLIYRLVKMVMTDASAATTMNFTSKDAFNKWLLTQTLENMADHCKDLITPLKEAGKKPTAPLKETMKSLQELYLDAIKSYNLQDLALAHKVADTRPQLADNLAQLSMKVDKKHEVEALKSLESMTNLIGNLTRLTLDHE